MRSIMLVCCAASMLLCGCDSSERDKHGRLIAERDTRDTEDNSFIVKDYGSIIRFKYVIVDKHEYLISTFDRGIGVTHSPNCQCGK